MLIALIVGGMIALAVIVLLAIQYGKAISEVDDARIENNARGRVRTIRGNLAKLRKGKR